MPIPRERRKRIAPAVLFLFGVLASLKAVGDSATFWPPDVVWAALSNPHRVQLCGGVAMMVVAVVISVAITRSSPRPPS
ncbi:MAG: hypothetical protein ACRD3B_08715 [Candidatus Sulfotelmatobacter sp.]